MLFGRGNADRSEARETCARNVNVEHSCELRRRKNVLECVEGEERATAIKTLAVEHPENKNHLHGLVILSLHEYDMSLVIRLLLILPDFTRHLCVVPSVHVEEGEVTGGSRWH